MHVILKWNQAGGLPTVADDELYDDAREAAAQARVLTLEAAPRRDRYTVHELELGEQVGWRDCSACGGKGAFVGVGLAGQQDADCRVCKGDGVELVDQEVAV